MSELQDPRYRYPTPDFREQQQFIPGSEEQMHPHADHGETSYRGSGKLRERVALITGADSGIGVSSRNGKNCTLSLWHQ